jgi:hypothetical protein
MPSHIRDHQGTVRADTPLAAVLAFTLLASMGMGIVWYGIPFIAKHDYGFSQSSTFALYIAIGVAYAFGALHSGSITERISRHVSPRGFLAWLLIATGVVGLLPIAFRGSWVVWVVAGVHALLSAYLWPIVESYLTAGRRSGSMRSAIGSFNIVWTSAVVLSMFLIAPLIETHAKLALAGVALCSALGLVTLIRFRPTLPMSHDDTRAIDVGPEYPYLLQSARILLPMSYVLSGTVAPLLPFVFGRMALDVGWETPTAATWMIARVLTVALMWRLGVWHGKWSALLAGGVAMTLGFGLIAWSTGLVMLLIGFAAFGVGIGIAYYTALYYAMAVGHARVEAGGKHEALIGLGYVLGPAAGMIGLNVDAATFAETDGSGSGIVVVVTALIAIAAVLALTPYFRSRRRRTYAVTR